MLAIVLFAPLAFLVCYATVFALGLSRELPWRDGAGVTVMARLTRGEAPLGVAFWVPIGLLICLWPVSYIGDRTGYFRYPAFNAVVSLANLALVVSWIWVTWKNAGNAQGPTSRWAALGVTFLFGVLTVQALVRLVYRLLQA